MPPPTDDNAVLTDEPIGLAPKPRARRFAGLGVALSQRPQRPVALALVAAAGLAIAAAGVFHPVKKEQAAVPAGFVALVNQEPILMTDFMNDVETIYGEPFADSTPEQRAKVLHNMINQELLVQRALALDLPEQDTDVRTSLADAVDAVVIAPTMAERPTDADLQAYFNAHRASYANQGSMTLTDLVLHVGGFENTDQSVDQAMADAAQAVFELRSGANVDYVKQHFSMVDSGRANGMDLDFAAKIHLGAKLYAVASAMSDGQVSEPVADTDGVHVMIMQHRQAPVFADLDSVRNNVANDYFMAQEAKVKQDNLQFLRSNAQILLAPGQGE